MFLSAETKRQCPQLLNRWLLRSFLKQSRDRAFLISCGILFHSVGAAIAKARSPYDFKRLRGTCRSSWSDDHRALFGWYSIKRSSRYCGASSWMHLYVSVRILKMIRLFMGSQCSEFNTGVMCSNFLVLVSIRAAVFWILIHCIKHLCKTCLSYMTKIHSPVAHCNQLL